MKGYYDITEKSKALLEKAAEGKEPLTEIEEALVSVLSILKWSGKDFKFVYELPCIDEKAWVPSESIDYLERHGWILWDFQAEFADADAEIIRRKKRARFGFGDGLDVL